MIRKAGLFKPLFYFPANKKRNLPKTVRKEEIKELDEFVESAVYEKPVDSKFVSIIEEEYALYLNGNRDLEKTIDVIENRVDIALKESY